MCQQPSAASAALSQVEDDAFFNPEMQFLVSTRELLRFTATKRNTVSLYQEESFKRSQLFFT